MRDNVKKVTREFLDKIIFTVNNHCQEDAGSPYLPNIVEGFIKNRELIEKRTQKQLELVRKNGRACPNQYMISDRVIIQDHLSKRWSIYGKVTEKRISGEGSFWSFIVLTDAGRELIKHEWKVPIQKKVTFSLPCFCRVRLYQGVKEQPQFPVIAQLLQTDHPGHTTLIISSDTFFI